MKQHVRRVSYGLTCLYFVFVLAPTFAWWLGWTAWPFYVCVVPLLLAVGFLAWSIGRSFE